MISAHTVPSVGGYPQKQTRSAVSGQLKSTGLGI